MDARGEFVVRGSAPVSWFGAFQRANPPANLRDAAWMALGARADAHPLRQLTYDSARPHDFVFLYQASPFGQSALFELAREVVVRERLGQGGGIDYLVVTPGFSTMQVYNVPNTRMEVSVCYTNTVPCGKGSRRFATLPRRTITAFSS